LLCVNDKKHYEWRLSFSSCPWRKFSVSLLVLCEKVIWRLFLKIPETFAELNCCFLAIALIWQRKKTEFALFSPIIEAVQIELFQSIWGLLRNKLRGGNLTNKKSYVGLSWILPILLRSSSNAQIAWRQFDKLKKSFNVCSTLFWFWFFSNPSMEGFLILVLWPVLLLCCWFDLPNF
jgi:hypothetical protein